jgi:hypothetical protein
MARVVSISRSAGSAAVCDELEAPDEGAEEPEQAVRSETVITATDNRLQRLVLI